MGQVEQGGAADLGPQPEVIRPSCRRQIREKVRLAEDERTIAKRLKKPGTPGKLPAVAWFRLSIGDYGDAAPCLTSHRTTPVFRRATPQRSPPRKLYQLAAQHRGLFRKADAATIVDLKMLDQILGALPAAEITSRDETSNAT